MSKEMSMQQSYLQMIQILVVIKRMEQEKLIEILAMHKCHQQPTFKMNSYSFLIMDLFQKRTNILSSWH